MVEGKGGRKGGQELKDKDQCEPVSPESNRARTLSALPLEGVTGGESPQEEKYPRAHQKLT